MKLVIKKDQKKKCEDLTENKIKSEKKIKNVF